MIKLIDFRSETEKDVEFGTCELCFYTSDLEKGFFVFQDDTGATREIETGYWDLGDYVNEYYIENIPQFAEHVREKGKDLNFSDFDEKTCDCGCEGYVFNLASWFTDVYNSYEGEKAWFWKY